MPTSPNSPPDLTEIVAGLVKRIDRLENPAHSPDPASVYLADLTITGLGNTVTRYNDPVTNTPRASVQWTWTDNRASTNTDPVLDPIQKYQVSMTTPNSTVDKWSDSSSTSFTADNLPLNSNVTLKVRAVAYSGRVGLTATSTAATSKDSVPPNQPSTPTVTSVLRGLKVVWNGLDVSSNPMASDTVRIEVHASTTSVTFTPTPATFTGYSFPPAGGTLSILMPDYQPYYVRLVAYDNSSNASVPSTGVGPVSPAKAVDTDMGIALPGDIAFRDEGNLVLDGSFESSLVRADRVANGTVIGNVSFDNTAGLAAHGNWCLKFVGDGNTTKQMYLLNNALANAEEIPVNVMPSQKLYVAVRIRGVSANGTAALLLAWRDASNVVTNVSAITTSSSTGSYVLFEAVVVPPSTAVYLNVACVTTSQTAGTWYFDAVQVRPIQGTALIEDAAITNAKIALLAVNDANIANLNGGKIDALSIDTTRLGLGVLRNNLVNNPGFEELFGTDPTNPTLFTAAGQGDVNNWRREATTATCSSYRGTTKARSGAGRGTLSIIASGTTADNPRLYTNTFLLEAGITYKVTWSTVSNGAGASAAGGKVTVDALFGTTQTTINTSNAANQNLTDGTYMVSPYSAWAGIVGTTYDQGSAELTIPGGQTDLWCTIRFSGVGNNPDTAVLIDDVAVVKTGIGGAVEITVAGMRLFGDDGEEVAALVSNNPNRLMVMDGFGSTIGGIDDEGGVFGTSGTFSSDLTVGGRPLVGLYGGSIPFDLRTTVGDDPDRDYDANPIGIIEAYSKGTVQWQIFDPAGLNKTVNNGGTYVLYDVAFDVEAGRQYTVFQSPITVNGTAGTVAGLVMRYTTDGSVPSTSSSTLVRLYQDIGSTGNCQIFMPPGRLFNGIIGQEQLRIIGILFPFGSNMTIGAFEQFTVGIMDLGATKTAEGRLINSTSTTSGGSAITKTYTGTWMATNSESYGNFGARPEANLYQGYYSSNQGHQWASIVFNGGMRANNGAFTGQSIATAMSGATLKKVELRLTNADWYYNNGGTAYVRAQTSTSLITGTPTGTAKAFSGWAVGATKWVDITSIATSAIRGVTLGKAPSTSKTYYGQFQNHQAGYPPLLKLTWSK